MAIYHCNITSVSRGKGSSACAALAYISGKKVREERTGRIYDYGRKERVVYTDTILPKSAPAEYRDPEKLFNAIENFEKSKTARTAVKIEVALPREFDPETAKRVLTNYIKSNLTSAGYAATYSIHIDNGNNNPHAHILIPNRRIDDKGKWKSKQKKEYVLDESGNRIPIIDKSGNQKKDAHGRKQWKRISVDRNPLDSKNAFAELRKSWAKECNVYLEPDQHIDHRSYEEQGEALTPTVHEGHASRKRAERQKKNAPVRRRNDDLKGYIRSIIDTTLDPDRPDKERVESWEDFEYQLIHQSRMQLRRSGNTISFRPQDTAKAVRGNRLGDDYTLNAILDRIEDNGQIRLSRGRGRGRDIDDYEI